MDERAQAYTLEGLVAAVLIASSVILGLQAVAVAPWTAGPSGETVETLRTQGSDLLTAAADDGTLRRAVTCLDGGSPETAAYVPNASASATPLGPMLDEVFAEQGYDYNVYLHYWESAPNSGIRSGTPRNTTVVYPSSGPDREQNGVVTVSRRVVLYDSMVVRERRHGGCAPTNRTLAAGTDRYVGDAYPDSPVYNVVEVRLEVW